MQNEYLVLFLTLASLHSCMIISSVISGSLSLINPVRQFEFPSPFNFLLDNPGEWLKTYKCMALVVFLIEICCCDDHGVVCYKETGL